MSLLPKCICGRSSTCSPSYEGCMQRNMVSNLQTESPSSIEGEEKELVEAARRVVNAFKKYYIPIQLLNWTLEKYERAHPSPAPLVPDTNVGDIPQRTENQSNTLEVPGDVVEKRQPPDGFKRRDCVYLFTPAEKAIYDAVQQVERAGCHVFLTDAVNLLHKARQSVADFVDGIELPKPSEDSQRYIPTDISPEGFTAASLRSMVRELRNENKDLTTSLSEANAKNADLIAALGDVVSRIRDITEYRSFDGVARRNLITLADLIQNLLAKNTKS